jgi:hypothetical protein
LRVCAPDLCLAHSRKSIFRPLQCAAITRGQSHVNTSESSIGVLRPAIGIAVAVVLVVLALRQ